MKFSVKLVIATLVLSPLVTGTATAGLLNTDGADPVEAKHAEVELNGSYARDTDKSGGNTTRTASTDGDMTITVGIVKGLDVAVTLPYTFSAREKVNGSTTEEAKGFNDMAIGLKYQFLELDGLRLAVKPGIILPSGKESEGLSDGKTGLTVAFIATKEFSEGQYAVHANAGYERHNFNNQAVDDVSRSDIFSFSMAAEAEVAEGLKVQAELGFATNTDNTSSTPLAYTTIGATYGITKNLEGYAGAKVGLTKPEDDVTALFGIKFKF